MTFLTVVFLLIAGALAGGAVVWFWKAQIIADEQLLRQKAQADLIAIKQAAKAKGINL